VVLRKPSSPVFDGWRHAKETKHPSTVLPCGFVFFGGEPAQALFYGL
jgi:hypothetical protein